MSPVLLGRSSARTFSVRAFLRPGLFPLTYLPVFSEFAGLAMMILAYRFMMQIQAKTTQSIAID
ncbi:hypothetical protein B9H00_05970 [Kushneria marisflavi]|uniref:Uncharacterized protein n=1 Tax=Kushneria marisflavi TaxID=157779 RepID=A0A240UNN5_9GAMM|nr:hypothetical protein B9H00_05970 [Kushneria marisflavi]